MTHPGPDAVPRPESHRGRGFDAGPAQLRTGPEQALVVQPTHHAVTTSDVIATTGQDGPYRYRSSC